MSGSGTSFAPSLTLIALAAVAAHVARLVAPRDSPHVFATVSNGALLCAGLLCPLDDGALAVMLAGAASLAFHAETAPAMKAPTRAARFRSGVRELLSSADGVVTLTKRGANKMSPTLAFPASTLAQNVPFSLKKTRQPDVTHTSIKGCTPKGR